MAKRRDHPRTKRPSLLRHFTKGDVDRLVREAVEKERARSRHVFALFAEEYGYDDLTTLIRDDHEWAAAMEKFELDMKAAELENKRASIRAQSQESNT